MNKNPERQKIIEQYTALLSKWKNLTDSGAPREKTLRLRAKGLKLKEKLASFHEQDEKIKKIVEFKKAHMKDTSLSKMFSKDGKRYDWYKPDGRMEGGTKKGPEKKEDNRSERAKALNKTTVYVNPAEKLKAKKNLSKRDIRETEVPHGIDMKKIQEAIATKLTRNKEGTPKAKLMKLREKLAKSKSPTVRNYLLATKIERTKMNPQERPSRDVHSYMRRITGEEHAARERKAIENKSDFPARSYGQGIFSGDDPKRIKGRVPRHSMKVGNIFELAKNAKSYAQMEKKEGSISAGEAIGGLASAVRGNDKSKLAVHDIRRKLKRAKKSERGNLAVELKNAKLNRGFSRRTARRSASDINQLMHTIRSGGVGSKPLENVKR